VGGIAMRLSEMFAAFLDKKVSEEEMAAEMYKIYTGIEITPEQVKEVLSEVSK
jgi:hypothetical protein